MPSRSTSEESEVSLSYPVRARKVVTYLLLVDRAVTLLVAFLVANGTSSQFWPQARAGSCPVSSFCCM